MISVSEDYIKAMKSDVINPIVKIELLDKEFNVLDEFTTDVSYDDIGSISVDKTRDLRRQISITFDNHNGKFTWGENKLIWIDQKFIKVYIGFKIPTGEIEYAPQGVFVLTSPEAMSSPTENTVTINGQDLWYLLTGNLGKVTSNILYSAFMLDSNGDYVVGEDNMPVYRMEYDDDGNPIRKYRITNYIISVLRKMGITKMMIDDCDASLSNDMTYDVGDNYGQILKDLTAQCYKSTDNYFYECFFDVNGYFRFQKFQKPTEIAPCMNFSIEDFTTYAGSNRVLDDSTLFNHIIVRGGSDNVEFESEEIIDESTYEMLKFGDSTKTEFDEGTYSDTSCNYLGVLSLAQGKTTATIGDETRVVGNGKYKLSGTFTSKWFEIKTDHKYKEGNVSWIDTIYDSDVKKKAYEKICTVCGYKSKEETDEHTHLWSRSISTYDNYCHYYACQYDFCDEKLPEPHDMPMHYTEYPKLGYKSRKCKKCDYEEKLPLNTNLPDSHTHKYALADLPEFPDLFHANVCTTEGCYDVSEAGISLGNSDDRPRAQEHCFFDTFSSPYTGNHSGGHTVLSSPNKDLSIPGIRIDKCRCGHEKVATWTTASKEDAYIKHTECEVAEDAVWIYDSQEHWHHCNYILGCPERLDVSNHVWDDGTVTKQATTTEKGEVLYKCTICGYTKTEEIEKIYSYDLEGSDGHKHNSENDNFSADENYHFFICDECGEKYSVAPHKWNVTDTVVVEPALRRHTTVQVTIQYGNKDKQVVAEEVVENGGKLTTMSEGDDIFPYIRYVVKLTTDNTSYSPEFENIQIAISTQYQPWLGHPYSIQKIGDRIYFWNDGLDSNIVTQDQCNKRAVFELEKNLCYTEDVTLSTLPIYTLEPDDVISITDEYNGCKDNYQIVSFTIPIKPAIMDFEVQKIRGDLV